MVLPTSNGLSKCVNFTMTAKVLVRPSSMDIRVSYQDQQEDAQSQAHACMNFSWRCILSALCHDMSNFHAILANEGVIQLLDLALCRAKCGINDRLSQSRSEPQINRMTTLTDSERTMRKQNA